MRFDAFEGAWVYWVGLVRLSHTCRSCAAVGSSFINLLGSSSDIWVAITWLLAALLAHLVSCPTSQCGACTSSSFAMAAFKSLSPCHAAVAALADPPKAVGRRDCITSTSSCPSSTMRPTASRQRARDGEGVTPLPPWTWRVVVANAVLAQCRVRASSLVWCHNGRGESRTAPPPAAIATCCERRAWQLPPAGPVRRGRRVAGSVQRGWCRIALTSACCITAKNGVATCCPVLIAYSAMAGSRVSCCASPMRGHLCSCSASYGTRQA